MSIKAGTLARQQKSATPRHEKGGTSAGFFSEFFDLFCLSVFVCDASPQADDFTGA